MNKNERLKIALQKKGRLYEESSDLLTRCGLQISNHNQALIYHCKNLPIDLLFVRDDDIPTLVANKICDLGIVGENVVYEKFDDLFQETNLLKEDTLAHSQDKKSYSITFVQAETLTTHELEKSKPNHPFNLGIDLAEKIDFDTEKNFNKKSLYIIKKLGFGICQLAIAIPKDQEFMFPDSIQNKRIATSYPNLLNKFLREQHINAAIVPLSGSVEIAPRLEIADMICDLISSGQTMEANFLKPVVTLLSSQAILISAERQFPAQKQAIFDLLLCRINGVLQAQSRKYILFHAPRSALPAITQLLPGTESPTILPLQGNENTVAVHVVSREAVFWDTLEKLKQVGASSILVLPIEKMMS